jgi:predicted TIM-barrel fold metal-dependent hydrolase
MRLGAYDPVARAAEMDRAGILASLCFPSFPRFCGQMFFEGKDKELSALCVRAYNDWMIDEWCAAVPGRYIPLVIIPLWDPPGAANELERCATKGARAFAFSENPEPLGLPTIHDPSRYWDPVMAAANGTDNVMVEVDYPHSDTTWPNSIDIARRLVAHLPEDLQYKVLPGNAQTLFRFTPTEPALGPAV